MVSQILSAVAGAGTDVGVQLHQVAPQLVSVVPGDLPGGLVDPGAGRPQHHHIQIVHVAAWVGDSSDTLCRQRVQCPAGGVIGAECATGGVHVRHV